MVEDFKAKGGSVLLTTHYMEEAERLADDLLVIDGGKIISRGTPAEIIATLGVDSIVEFRPEPAFDGDGYRDELAALPGVCGVNSAGADIVLNVDSAQASLPALFRYLAEQGRAVSDLSTHRPTLEDVFVHLTGRQLRDG